ncbi:armadillo-type protein [Cyathus striatus]|nr:armadillo-type protein [Cyathus striatus]
MGKSQKKRSMRRHNPVRVPDSHIPKGLAPAAESSSKRDAILPIMQKMESADAGERKWACVAVSNLIQNDPSTRRLLQGKNIVGSLITRLTDSEEEVFVEAAGALRNLCIDGGYEICAEMYNKNILTPVKSFVPKISTTLSQFLSLPKTAPDNAQKIVYEFADNIITILWCLSETSNKALNAINDIYLIPFLMSFVASRDNLPISTVLSAAQCLYVLTDDNYPAITDVRADGSYLTCLLDIARADVPQDISRSKDVRPTTLRVLAAGILRNLLPLPPPSAASFVDIDKEIVLPLLQPVISLASLPEASNIVQQLVTRQIELDQLEAKLRTVQLSLEILTGTCAMLPDPEPTQASNESDENYEDVDEDIPEDDDMQAEMDTVDDVTLSDGLNLSVVTPLVPLLLALIQPTSLSFPPLAAPSPHPPTTSVLSAIHVCALECLNNLFLSLATSSQPTIASDKDAGRSLVGTQTGPGQERRQEMWSVGVGVLWGVGNIWKGSLVGTNEEQIKLLMQLCDGTKNDQLRFISNYLLSLLPDGNNASTIGTEPVIQVASALIDIYSDETMPYDINFREGHYLGRLSNAVDGIRKAVHAIDRRKEGGKELRRRGEEVRDNLLAFLQYRKELRL